MQKRKSPKHGTINVYTNYRCRCERCRAAAASYQRRARDRREQSLKEAAS